MGLLVFVFLLVLIEFINSPWLVGELTLWIWQDEMDKLIALHAEKGKGFFYQGQFKKAKLDLEFARSLADSFNIVYFTDSILAYQLKKAATLGENYLITFHTDCLTKLFNSRSENKAAEIVASI